MTRRRFANLYPSFKAAVDGLVDARVGPVVPGGQIVLHITALEAE